MNRNRHAGKAAGLEFDGGIGRAAKDGTSVA
jgi:hypothetical protein